MLVVQVRGARPEVFGMGLPFSVDFLRQSGPVVLLLRHAARGPVLDPLGGTTVPLTPAGIATAEQLGAAYASLGPVRLWHSPVFRCQQTAEALAAGIRQAGGEAEPPVVQPALGGPYLLRLHEAFAAARALGPAFVRAWFDETLAAGLLKPRRAAAREQLAVCAAALDAGPCGLAVLITHDWNVLAVREECFGLRHEDVGWVDFLEGVAVRRVAGGLAVQHGNCAAELAF